MMKIFRWNIQPPTKNAEIDAKDLLNQNGLLTQTKDKVETVEELASTTDTFSSHGFIGSLEKNLRWVLHGLVRI
jgi:hypothetical protein